MNKKSYILSTVGLVGCVLINTPVFADETNAPQDMQKGGHMERSSTGFLSTYLRSDLTTDEQTALQTVITNHEAAVKALRESASGSTDSNTLKTQMQTQRDAYAQALLPYIATDKQTEFTKMMSAMPTMGNGRNQDRTGSGSEQNNMGYSILDRFIRSDLTADEKAALQTLQKDHETQMRQWMETNSGSLDTDATKSALQSLNDTYITALLPYIATDKQDELRTWVSQRSTTRPTTERTQTKTTHLNRDTTTQRTTNTTYTGLSQSVIKAVDAKLATFASDTDRISWINTIITKIDAALAKNPSQKIQTVLNALKNLLNDRLDTLSGTSSSDDLLNLIQ